MPSKMQSLICVLTAERVHGLWIALPLEAEREILASRGRGMPPPGPFFVASWVKRNYG